jgi:serine protease AprX
MLARLSPRLCHVALITLALFLVAAVLAAPYEVSPGIAQAAGRPKIAPALLVQMQAGPRQRLPVIVLMKPVNPTPGGNLDQSQQALAILQAHGQAFGALPIVNGAAGYANAVEIKAISLLPQVDTIESDALVGPRRPATPGNPRPTGRLSSLDVREVNADRALQRGATGRGVAVAVLDSGVAPDRDLSQAGNRLLASVSFAGTSDPEHPDKGGHGTHIAGTIAGDGSASAGQFVGIAPRANIVSVQVLDANGRGRISSVLAGLQWVLLNKDRFNIRVVNLSFGATTPDSYIRDPMAAGAEFAWRNGLVVVAAAGNTGPARNKVETPGVDPYVITVGSTDDQLTLSLDDDTLAWFSGWGTPANSTPKPDLVAPGRQVVGPRVPGSVLDRLFPNHVVTASNGAKYFRLTGTSMATAIVSGAVALVFQRRSDLSPDQVKRALTTSAQRFGRAAPAPPPGAAGAGLLDANRSLSGRAGATFSQGQRPADGLLRALYPALYGQPLQLRDGSFVSWLTATWDNIAWDNIAWDNIAWDNIAWDNIAWDANGQSSSVARDNIAWDNIAWDNIAWDNIAWDNIAWDNIAWDNLSSD